MSAWIMLAWAAIPILIWVGYSKEVKMTFKEVFILGLIFGGIAGVSLLFDHWLGYTAFWIIFAMAALIAISPESVDTEQTASSSSDVINKYSNTLALQSESESDTAVTSLKKGRLPKSSQKSKSYATTKQSKQAPVKKTASQETSPPSKTRKRTHYSRSEVRQIAFDYIDSSGSFTSREVAVNSFDGTYLKGYCLEKGATRTFKLENICGLVTLRETGELLSIDEWEDAWLSL